MCKPEFWLGLYFCVQQNMPAELFKKFQDTPLPTSPPDTPLSTSIVLEQLAANQSRFVCLFNPYHIIGLANTESIYVNTRRLLLVDFNLCIIISRAIEKMDQTFLNKTTGHIYRVSHRR